MKTESQLPSPIRPLADWRLFAAAGASLAAVSQADSAIIYIGGYPTSASINPTISAVSQHSAQASLFGAGPTVLVRHTTLPLLHYAAASLKSAQGLFRFGFSTAFGGFHLIKNFASGAAINLAVSTTKGLLRNGVGRSGHDGNFLSGQAGFVGFKFQRSGAVNFYSTGKGTSVNASFHKGDLGWMRIEVFDQNGDGKPDKVELIDLAWNDAGGPIDAGQTMDAAVPEPGGKALALLAAGAAGVLAWRKRRNEAAQAAA